MIAIYPRCKASPPPRWKRCGKLHPWSLIVQISFVTIEMLMKKILREIFIYSFVLYVVPFWVDGLKIKGGIKEILIGGVLLTVGHVIVKPVLKIITLPFNVITFGLFSSLITIFILYLTTRLYPNIQVTPFKFRGLDFLGIKIPIFDVNIILSYIIISAIIYILYKVLSWLISK